MYFEIQERGVTFSDCLAPCYYQMHCFEANIFMKKVSYGFDINVKFWLIDKCFFFAVRKSRPSKNYQPKTDISVR